MIAKPPKRFCDKLGGRPRLGGLSQSKRSLIPEGPKPSETLGWGLGFAFCSHSALSSFFVRQMLFKNVLLEDKVLSLVTDSAL